MTHDYEAEHSCFVDWIEAHLDSEVADALLGAKIIEDSLRAKVKSLEDELREAEKKLTAVKDAAETWADFAPADDWGEGGLANTVTADLGRHILRLVKG